MNAAGVLVPVALFAMIGFISWVIISSIYRFRVARIQATAQIKLLERFSSAESLLAYGETSGGQQFMKSLVEERQSARSPYKNILSSVQAGIILIVFGLALLFLHHSGVTPEDAVIVFGTVPVALGIGFLLSAGATFALSTRFGLLAK